MADWDMRTIALLAADESDVPDSVWSEFDQECSRRGGVALDYLRPQSLAAMYVPSGWGHIRRSPTGRIWDAVNKWSLPLIWHSELPEIYQLLDRSPFKSAHSGSTSQYKFAPQTVRTAAAFKVDRDTLDKLAEVFEDL